MLLRLNLLQMNNQWCIGSESFEGSNFYIGSIGKYLPKKNSFLQNQIWNVIVNLTQIIFVKWSLNLFQMKDPGICVWSLRVISWIGCNRETVQTHFSKGILSTTNIIFSYPKLLSFSVLTFIKWRLNTEYATKRCFFRFKKADHRYWKLINYALTWARPNLFLSIFMPVARMLQHGC